MVISGAFQRKCDPESGRYYHVLKGTGERVWDVPSGLKVPLEGPSEEARISATLEARHAAEDKARVRQDRLSVADALKRASLKADRRELSKKEAAEKARLDDVWRSACARGKADGNVRVSWQKLGYISSQIYSFEQDYGRDLTSLSIVGNDLETWGDIPQLCQHLVQLSLTSNRIKHLGEDVHHLAHLVHLNLLKNQLEKLPSNIGALKNLEVLEVAGNCLVELPPSIADLANLKHLNLECNRLQRLPETMGNMKCEVLNLNSNELTALPRSVGSMSALRKLSVNDNRLSYLPAEIGYSMRLDTIHASKNRLMELPASIGRLTSLQCLWLDSNRLSALPTNFHKLKKLRVLKMEGNADMVLPPLNVLVRGAEAVLRWSDCRFESSENSRKQNIVLSVQDVLKQVAQYKNISDSAMSQPHESLFEDNVEFRGDACYQIVPEALWDVFLPSCQEMWSRDGCTADGIRSFPYGKKEVEKVLAEFRDASGRVMRHHRKATFRRCSCKINSGKKTVCVGTCERPAWLIRKSVTLERDMTEKRRRQVEQIRIDEAVRAAERLAQIYLSTDEGKIVVRQRAEARVLVAMGAITADDSRIEHRAQRDAAEDTAPGNGGRPERSAQMRAKLRMGYSKKLKEMEEIVRCEFIEKEVEDRRELAEDTNQKIKVILKSWLGLNMEDVFMEWKAVVRREKKQRRRDDRKLRIAERIQYESELAKLEYAKREAKQWKKCWDDFNDVPYWIHVHTEESVYDEPTADSFLPYGWTRPQIPPHLVDKESGDMRSMASIRETEMDSLDSSDAGSADDESDTCSFESEESKCKGVKVEIAKDCVGVEREALLAASRLLQCRRELLLEKRKKSKTKRDAAY